MADNKNFLDEGGVKALWSVMNREFPRLDESDKVPSRYLPSYVDDVVEIEDRLKIIGVDDTDYSEDAMQGELMDFLDTISSSTYSKREGDDVMGVYYINYYGLFVLKVISEEDGVSSETHYFSWEPITEGEGDNAVVIYPDSSDYGVVKSVAITNGSVSITQGVTASEWYFYNQINTQDYYAVDTDGNLSKYAFESGKIYLNKSLNKTYRWSGSQLVEVGGGVALGETAETAFAGNKGKEVYDAVFTKNMPVVTPTIVVESLTATDQSGNPITAPEKSSSVTIERGIKLTYKVGFKWNSASGYKDPVEIVQGTTWYDSSKDKGGLPQKGAISAYKQATVENAVTLTAKVAAPKIGLMVDANNNVTKAEGNDEASATFKVSLTYRRFFGEIDNGAIINEALIKGLSSELNTSRGKTIAINVDNSHQYVYAYESALGEASIAKGVEDDKAFWDTGTLSITNQYGKTITYRYYACTAGAYKGASVKFS